MPNFEPAKHSVKPSSLVTAYAANTNQGIIRNYNEDRVSIILNINKPKSKVVMPHITWPKCSFFAVYDGHGGANCADFLRDHLHHFIIKEPSFPENPADALKKGCLEAERFFLDSVERRLADTGFLDKSGSCAIIILIVNDTCYVGNVGDSRAIMSADGGKTLFTLSRDHKPTEENEKKRITENGGKIYQN